MPPVGADALQFSCVYDEVAAPALRARDAALAAVPKARALCALCIPHGGALTQPPSAAQEAHRAVNGLREAPGRVLAELAPAPIRITPVFQLATTAALSQAKADFVRSLIPAALAEIARYLSVLRPVRRGALPTSARRVVRPR